jgi:hypothetical protein
MTRKPLPIFELWLPAIKNGILPADRLVQWADKQIGRLDDPPYWLLELATAKDVAGIEKAMRSANLPDLSESYHDDGIIFLAYLYLGHVAGKISLFDLLQRAGKYSDGKCSSKIPECEEFYLLLNELDGGGPTIPSNRSLQERVAELFATSVRTLREKFGIDESTPIEAMLPETF